MMNLADAVTSTRNAQARKREAAPDLTMLRDWREIWDDLTDVPDFPEQPNPHNPPLTRQQAEDRLKRLSTSLNGPGPVRPPTDEERAEALEQLEKRDPSGRKRFMAEQAVSIRAYLAKLDARDAANKARQAAHAKERAQRRVAAFEAQMASLGDELPELIAGAERHRQRKADEAAHYRLLTMRSDIAAERNRISREADEARIPGPSSPDWLNDIPGDL